MKEERSERFEEVEEDEMMNKSLYTPIMFDSNFSSTFINESSVYPDPDPLITSPYYLLITIVCSIGNLIILSVISCTPHFRKPANYLVANLSLSSILFTISTNLRLVENSYDLWMYTSSWCGMLAVLHRIPIPTVALTTMLISLDRGRLARNPVSRSFKMNPLWKIIAIWGFAIVMVMPLGLTRKVDKFISTPYKCTKIKMFGSPFVSMMYGICYLLSIHIIPAYILIRESVKTRSKMKFLRLSNVPQTEQPEVSFVPDSRLRMLRNSCIFTVIFLTTWLPYGIFQFPLDLPPELLPGFLEVYIRFYFRFLWRWTYLQICINSVILFVLSYDLKKYLPCLC